MKRKVHKPADKTSILPVYPIDLLSEGSPRRWMLFVDGENFTFRAQEFARQQNLTLEPGRYYLPDTFIWLPKWGARRSLIPPMAPISIEASAVRAYYYTSVVGDDQRIKSVEKSLWENGFQAKVFKKQKQQAKTKGVDIALATDFLSNAFANNYDVAVLIAGDADYIPMVNEVKRLGKLVYVVFFHGKNLGLSVDLHLASDQLLNISNTFYEQWREYLDSRGKAK